MVGEKGDGDEVASRVIRFCLVGLGRRGGGWDNGCGCKIVSRAGLQRMRGVAVEFARQPLAPAAQIAAAAGVAMNVLLLSDNVPKATVIRQRAPIADLNACLRMSLLRPWP
jgi:hypothetical protein